MLRYNRSFVGLMETCNDGQWILAKDYDDKVSEMLTEQNKLIETINKLENFNNYLYDENIKMMHEKYNNKILSFYTILLAAIVVSIPLTLILSKYHA